MRLYIEIPRPDIDELAGCEIELHPGRPARMYLNNGDPGYPEEPPEAELIVADDEDGITIPEEVTDRWPDDWFRETLLEYALEAAEREAEDER